MNKPPYNSPFFCICNAYIIINVQHEWDRFNEFKYSITVKLVIIVLCFQPIWVFAIVVGFVWILLCSFNSLFYLYWLEQKRSFILTKWLVSNGNQMQRFHSNIHKYTRDKIFIFLIAMHSEYDLLRFFKKCFAFVCNLMMLFARMNNEALEVFIIE